MTKFTFRYGMDDTTYNAYKSANADRRTSVFCVEKIKQSVSSGVKTAAESASTGVKTATETGKFITAMNRYGTINIQVK